jgi:hypothetical protein
VHVVGGEQLAQRVGQDGGQLGGRAGVGRRVREAIQG